MAFWWHLGHTLLGAWLLAVRMPVRDRGDCTVTSEGGLGTYLHPALHNGWRSDIAVRMLRSLIWPCMAPNAAQT